MEDFAAYAGGREDIWYATNIQVYDYVTAYERLQYSTDGSLVYNPTVTDVWLSRDGKRWCVKAGETLELA